MYRAGQSINSLLLQILERYTSPSQTFYMKLTPKELREKELIKKYNKHYLGENLADYHLLADTLLYLHDAIVERQVPIEYWQKESQTLLYKFAFHGLTLHQILGGYKLSSLYYKDKMSDNKIFIDMSSAKAILRAQFEAFLMYHHIYVNPIEDDMKELRYNAWIYSSLLQRQKFPANTDFAKKQKDKDLTGINKLKEKICKLKSFQNLTRNQQDSLLNKGSGKLFSHWATILKETGFSENTPFYTVYTLLCMHAHSEGLGIIQLSNQPHHPDNVIHDAKLDLHNSKALICLMINSIIDLHEVVKERYQNLPDQIKYDVEIYSMWTKGTKA